MPAKPRSLIVGNWKMNGLRSSLVEIAHMARGYDSKLRRACEFIVCPPATLVYFAAKEALGSHIGIGAQDCHIEASGAFTGEVSAEMLADSGATTVIVGHSERRSYSAETDGDVKSKALAALRAGLMPIICVGETNSDREGGHTLAVIKRQLSGSVPGSADSETLVVAYEPIWAIGTGLTPTLADIAEVHRFIHRELNAILGSHGAALRRVLYGGSVKPSNAREILALEHVDGALVGGASLKAEDFLAIARAAPAPH
ncbi:MAG: triose-phosphate isomerase [Hyphomicrobiales bacterium]|nr:triose-phosphate isomerase [Hyphomicrobiales bacterium]MBV9114241.1 triose-phosphate isomerase [Hyphomicrobiales bacterium]MBV9519411.1 triose-phosphate isomerase [Hyphomicrobiales bacterium]